jgi:HlyD family secretion protein
MIDRYVLPFLALIGVGLAISAVIKSNQSAPVVPAVAQSPKVPFASYVAGAGMIEASTENIAIGTPVSGIVTAIYVSLGDRANAGDPLFKIDDRDLQGQLLVAIAKVKAAEATVAKAKSVWDFSQGLRPKQDISSMELANRRLDVAIGEAALALAKAEVDQLKIEIERRTVRAPVPGTILQIKTRLGEFAQGGVLATPLMLLGDTNFLRVRVDIDENDAWRVRPEAAALAFVRSNPDLNAPIEFDHFEPYVIPKTSLTGRSNERADTRVLQAIYSLDRAAIPVYVGQQVDVFVEAPPIAGASAQTTVSANAR